MEPEVGHAASRATSEPVRTNPEFGKTGARIMLPVAMPGTAGGGVQDREPGGVTDLSLRLHGPVTSLVVPGTLSGVWGTRPSADQGCPMRYDMQASNWRLLFAARQVRTTPQAWRWVRLWQLAYLNGLIGRSSRGCGFSADLATGVMVAVLDRAVSGDGVPVRMAYDFACQKA